MTFEEFRERYQECSKEEAEQVYRNYRLYHRQHENCSWEEWEKRKNNQHITMETVSEPSS